MVACQIIPGDVILLLLNDVVIIIIIILHRFLIQSLWCFQRCSFARSHASFFGFSASFFFLHASLVAQCAARTTSSFENGARESRKGLNYPYKHRPMNRK
jgi:hypothetical protein